VVVKVERRGASVGGDDDGGEDLVIGLLLRQIESMILLKKEKQKEVRNVVADVKENELWYYQ
jgi:hypothetical protein